MDPHRPPALRIRKALSRPSWPSTLLLVLAAALVLLGWPAARTPLEPVTEGRSPARGRSFDPALYRIGAVQFPGASWQPLAPDEVGRYGWSVEKLADAHAYARSLGTSSLIIVYRGVPIAMWGDVDRRKASRPVHGGLLGSLFVPAAADDRSPAPSTPAELIGMEDARRVDVVHPAREQPATQAPGTEIDHPSSVSMISPRDLARVGLLHLADGVWNGRRVLSEDRVRESIFEAARADGTEGQRHPAAWWIHPPAETDPEPMIVARVGRGYRLMILRTLDLVVVHHIAPGTASSPAKFLRHLVQHPSVSDREIGELMAKIVAAHPEAQRRSRTLGWAATHAPR